ncbi:cytochrome P450 [Roridomyces roridus]|uniref:Cytochrome P450 n=1 Tax=Roridomyces roridus TaxID=1738132 RepID=A0AAD7BHH3_9AGAR|nr:cytochrome P450 [Roridomyces roridus]
MSLLPTAAACILAVFALSWVYAGWSSKRLPPGPKPRFLVGNLKDLPTGGREWDSYAALARKYESDIIYMRVLGISILSINSFLAANELLNQRGAVWSDRPRLPMIKELMGWDWNLVLQSYNEGFAAHRRVVQQYFQPGIVATEYRLVMVLEVQVLLRNLLLEPTRFADHLKRMAGAIIIMITYGHQVRTGDDPFIQLAEEVRRHSEKTPGAALVDTIPILKYLPSCIAPFKRIALDRRGLSLQMRQAPFLMVKEQLVIAPKAAGKAVRSMVSTLLEDESADEELIQTAGVSSIVTATALTNFFLAMASYPDVQRQAQAELDRVVGRGRLPGFDDREQLPYIGAVVKETLRLEGRVPHCTTEADEYRGVYIPKKTTVLANISAMLHDPEVYPDPDQFIPERFIPNGSAQAAPDPARAAFGFGRRICPGRHFADDSIWIAISNILQVFSIRSPDHGLDVHWSSGLVSVPSQFLCGIQPRFEGAESLVEEEPER